jgi:hypothetical protein
MGTLEIFRLVFGGNLRMPIFANALPKNEVPAMFMDQAGRHGSKNFVKSDNVASAAPAVLLARAQSDRARLARFQGTLPLALPARDAITDVACAA